MKTVLLTGASGFLGKHIIAHKPSDWKITGLYNSTPPPTSTNATFLQVDLTNSKAVSTLFEEHQFDGVIHLAAISNANTCEQYPIESYAINVLATEQLAQHSANKNIPFVFTSTDLVFDGEQGNYSEEDIPKPLSTYGKQKLEAEQKVRVIYPEAAICRMPLMFGTGGSFLPSFLDKMRSGESLNLFTDEYRSILGGKAAALGLIHALSNFQGLYHIGGPERVDRYTFGKWMQEAFNIPNAKLVPTLQKELNLTPPRPADVTMNSSKANKARFKPVNPKTELIRLASTL